MITTNNQALENLFPQAYLNWNPFSKFQKSVHRLISMATQYITGRKLRSNQSRNWEKMKNDPNQISIV